ncbi:hypothetical protein KKH23_04950 [Patescibacteria group bacterium]|nr:hypothetical protein [Patescibacteria group bacterium]
MKEPLLVLDVPYLCHRAYHAMGGLVYDDAGTGAIFGVLRDIVALQDSFRTGRCVFAFDLGLGLRRKILPTYKNSRRTRYREAPEEEQAARRDFHGQVRLLREEYLPAAGFRNVFAAKGFEADDIIASVVAELPQDEQAIIVGSDQDLWQCLRPNVWCWNPQKRKAYTIELFQAAWGLEPEQWADVKAYAGCSTDDVPGVPGVGETTAAKWLRGELGEHTKAARKLDAARDVYERNIELVRLPFLGTPTFALRQDDVTEEQWQDLADRLGMKSIRTAVPWSVGRKSRGRKRGKQTEREEGFGL